MSNAPRGGRAYRSTKDDLWYFDRLPPTARRALADAAFNWSSAAVYNRWKRAAKGYKTGQDVASQVKQFDRKVIAKATQQEAKS